MNLCKLNYLKGFVSERCSELVETVPNGLLDLVFGTLFDSKGFELGGASKNGLFTSSSVDSSLN